MLSSEQIRDGWLKHIRSEEENFLWVSNQRAFDLMKEGFLPPETSDPRLNEHFEMIDAQLTTEIFGLLAPGRPDIAVQLAHLPIQTTAREEAEYISKFYVAMHALAAAVDKNLPIEQQIFIMADEASKVLPDSSYASKMYDYVRKLHRSGIEWEQTRDSVYHRYQVQEADGYDMTSRNLYCNGCYAAGINFAASLVSLFYGKGDFKETIKIGALTGWDSDNPTATWGGLLGFMIGKDGIEQAFQRRFSNRYHIHRTRQHFPDSVDTFEKMALKGTEVTQRVIIEIIGGEYEAAQDLWIIPL
jgi:hypothetical protein